MKYFFEKTTEYAFDEAVDKVTEELKKEGFGVLSEINIHEQLKEKDVYKRQEKTLSEIAYEMGYSSVAHLSGQFKKITGFTPTYFKNLREQNRKPIHDV